jgi:thiamine biosynthesis lipoprotein
LSVAIDNAFMRAVFPAMGNTAHITVLADTDPNGAPDLIEYARDRIQELESMWSRFIGDSDISRLTASNGHPIEVSPETVTLLRYMIAGWSTTNGLFDPSMLGELVRDGYARSRVSPKFTVLPEGVQWSKELDSVTIQGHTVTIPSGMALDPGGIGKGLAADIVATELMARGAEGVFVSIGGDIRCIGVGDCDGSWIIDIESPFDHAPLCSVALSEGAVATSSLTARILDESAHLRVGQTHRSHIMDSTNRRAIEVEARSIVQATVIASECVWAEIFTKPFLVLDDHSRTEFAAGFGLSAMVVDRSGAMTTSQTWKRFTS